MFRRIMQLFSRPAGDALQEIPECGFRVNTHIPFRTFEADQISRPHKPYKIDWRNYEASVRHFDALYDIVKTAFVKRQMYDLVIPRMELNFEWSALSEKRPVKNLTLAPEAIASLSNKSTDWLINNAHSLKMCVVKQPVSSFTRLAVVVHESMTTMQTVRKFRFKHGSREFEAFVARGEIHRIQLTE